MCYNASGSCGGRKKYKTPFSASHYFRVTSANLRDIYKAEFTIFPLKFTPPFTCCQLMALLFLLSVKTGTSPHACYYYLLDSSLSNLTKSLSVQFSRSVMSDSLQPHARQPARLPRPWDSPGKNTGVGCHFLLQCRKVKRERELDHSKSTASLFGIFTAHL